MLIRTTSVSTNSLCFLAKIRKQKQTNKQTRKQQKTMFTSENPTNPYIKLSLPGMFITHIY